MTNILPSINLPPRCALDTPEQNLEIALDCFVPALDLEARARVAALLQELAINYRQLAEMKARGAAPMRKMYTLVRNYQRLETEEEYAKRFTFWKNQPRRGRPRNFAAQVLVVNLRDILIAEGCHYGAPKEKDSSHTHLADLAEAVHLLSGVEGNICGWQDIAENCADPIFRWELVLGSGFSYDKTKKSEVKRMLASVEVRPLKRKAPSKRKG